MSSNLVGNNIWELRWSFLSISLLQSFNMPNICSSFSKTWSLGWEGYTHSVKWSKRCSLNSFLSYFLSRSVWIDDIPAEYVAVRDSFVGQPSRLSRSNDVRLLISRGRVIIKVFFRSSSRSFKQLLSSRGTSLKGLSFSQRIYRWVRSPILGSSLTMLL